MATISTINPSFGSEVTETTETFVNETKAIDIYESEELIIVEELTFYYIEEEVESTSPVLCGIKFTGQDDLATEFSVSFWATTNIQADPADTDDTDWVLLVDNGASDEHDSSNLLELLFPVSPQLSAVKYRVKIEIVGEVSPIMTATSLFTS